MLKLKLDNLLKRFIKGKRVHLKAVGVAIVVILIVICFKGITGRDGSVHARTEIDRESTVSKTVDGVEDASPQVNNTQVLPVAKKGETIMNTADVKDKANFYAVEFTEESEIFTRIKGKSYKDNCTVPLSDLRYLHVLHVGFDGKSHDGEIICNKYIADDLLEIFEELYEAKYPIEKIKLVDEYDADDEASMADNNSSSFNFRYISYTTKISKHGYGLAMDINTLYNPYVKTVNGKLSIEPANAADYVDRSKDFDYKIDEDDLAYKLFIAHGFEWGGSWKSSKDYQHFEVPDSVVKTLYK
ncbi:D-alanyl-D-alanine carboxypeptidase [Pseudobutyrivibrio sp. NOR37]|nr:MULTISPECIES: M15 family metallopeptidase [Pseudobutyrivibrio]SFR72802.1 D-alanyl-D-alanine carboxypeptidase [Pseudobutyrivibrio sp. NOR37]